MIRVGQSAATRRVLDSLRGTSTRRQWFSLAAGATCVLSGCAKTPPTVVYVNSYHAGYGPSDAIAEGIRDGLPSPDYDLITVFLDGKRKPELLPEAATKALELIRTRKPDVILVSDDDAMAHLVVPHLREGPTPVLFCGVNWSAEAYEVPNRYVAGMLEVLPVEETIQMVKAQQPEIKDLFVLSEDSPSEHKNRRFLDPIYWRSGLSTTYGLVPNFEEWKKAFTWANRNTDVVFFITHGAIKNWDEEQAVQHIRENIRVPVFTCDDWMIRYCVVGRVKERREPGDWIAQQTIRVLAGTTPEEIPLTRNKLSHPLGNRELADRIGFTLPPDVKA